jgi:hypothetical protein
MPAVAPTFGTVQGTGLPTARLRDIGTPPRGDFLAQRFVAKHTAQNDGTTLGFHPSSRPLS